MNLIHTLGKFIRKQFQNQQTLTAILILPIMTADDIDLTLPQTILQKKYATSRLKFRSHNRKNKAAKPNRELLTKWDHLLSEDVEQEVQYCTSSLSQSLMIDHHGLELK